MKLPKSKAHLLIGPFSVACIQEFRVCFSDLSCWGLGFRLLRCSVSCADS